MCIRLTSACHLCLYYLLMFCRHASLINPLPCLVTHARWTAVSYTYPAAPIVDAKICSLLSRALNSCRMDLRFIPEGQGFADRAPRESATDSPAGYEPPPFFTTAALQHSNVKLTWDATPDERRRALSKKVRAEELRDDDFKVIIARLAHRSWIAWVKSCRLKCQLKRYLLTIHGSPRLPACKAHCLRATFILMDSLWKAVFQQCE